MNTSDNPDSNDDTTSQTNVLIVDDEITNRKLCTMCLERAGYNVSQATDGHVALKMIKETPPDVIIMDVKMPNMDGLECTRILKSDPDTRYIPIIMLSILNERKDILAGLEAGADEYVTKPVKATELTLRVRSMARQHTGRKKLLRSYQMRGEHMRILTRLVEFCRAVGNCSRQDEVLEYTIEAISGIVHCQKISIMIPDSKNKVLKIIKFKGLDEELAATISVPIGEAISGKVFSSGRPIVINSDSDNFLHKKNYDSRFFASMPMISAPLGTSEQIIGVLNISERTGHLPFEPYEMEYIELIAEIAATSINSISTRKAHDQASDAIMIALEKLAEYRDNDTGKHLERVTIYCTMIAKKLCEQDKFRILINDTFLHDLTRSVSLHDIGKVATPDKILLYPGRLTDKQMSIMRTHAEIGARTIQALIDRTPGVGFLQMAADICHYHHEWYDGSGYPLGLKSDAIPLSARITAVADVYDALTSKRVYRNPISHVKSVKIIKEGLGTQFDPAIVEAFIALEKKISVLAHSMAD